MTFGPLRSLVLSLNQATHGVTATVTRPAPDNTPIATTGIWEVAPKDDSQPYGTDFRKVDRRRVMALARADLPTLPRGTTIVAPETLDGENKTWVVDGLERVDADTWRVIVLLSNQP